MSDYNKNSNKNSIDTVHTISIERTVLSSFLFDYKMFDRLNTKLKKDSFYLEAHNIIYESMLKLYHDEKPIDEEFIRKEIDDDKYDSALLEILTTNPTTNVTNYIEVLQENHKARELQSLANYINKIAHDEKVSNKEKVNTVQKKLSKISDIYEEKEIQEKNKNSIDLDKLSPYLSNLTKDLIEVNDYPPSMVLSTVLSSMAGLIGARAKVTNGINITVFPVVWSIIVAPSSLAAKSTLYRTAKKAIFGDLQQELYEEFKGKEEQYKIDLKNYRELSKEDKRNEIEPDKPEPKLLIFQSEGTPEAKIKSLQDNQNGGIIYYDEMRAELEKTNKDMSYKALKTSAFEGELLHKRLVNGGSTILDNPVLCEVGLITEQWLLEVVHKNDIASGFMARYLFSYNKREDFSPLQVKKAFIKENQYSEVGRFVIDMFEIDRKEPILFKLSQEAQEYYKDWFNAYSKSIYETETDEEITATYRLTTYVLKFALISYVFNNAYNKLDVVKSGLIEIPLEYIKEAIYIKSIFLEENNKVLHLFQKNKKLNYQINSIAAKLQKKIRSSKENRITKTSATNSIRGLNKEKLDEFIEQGLFKIEKIERTTYIYEDN